MDKKVDCCKQKERAKEIHDLAQETIDRFGGGGIYLDGKGNFVNCNQHPIEKFIILRKLTELSEALVRINSLAKTLM